MPAASTRIWTWVAVSTFNDNYYSMSTLTEKMWLCLYKMCLGSQQIHTHTHTHTHTHIYIYSYIYTCTYICIYIYVYIYMNMCVYIYIYIYSYIYTCTYIYISIYIHVYIYIHIHIYRILDWHLSQPDPSIWNLACLATLKHSD